MYKPIERPKHRKSTAKTQVLFLKQMFGKKKHHIRHLRFPMVVMLLFTFSHLFSAALCQNIFQFQAKNFL